MSIGERTLVQDLPFARASAVGFVAATGSSKGIIALAGVNLGNISFANGWALLEAGALGTDAPPTFAQITSNTATTVTPSAALSAVPASGYRVWFYAENTINVVTSENVAQVGGVTVPTDGAGDPALPVLSAGTRKTILFASIDVSASGSSPIIAAPTNGTAIKIVHLTLQNAGSTATNVEVLNGTTSLNGTGYALTANGGGYSFDAPGGPGQGVIVLSADTALQLNLSAASQVNGWVLYYEE